MRFSAAAVTLVLLSSLSCRREQPVRVDREETVVPVGAVAAQKGGIRAVIHASGLVVPAQGGEFLVTAPEPARLLDVLKAQGDPVSTGDVLARFDLPSAAQAVARLSADLAAAQAQVENARINEERIRGFVERGLVARRDLENAERELLDAQSALERTRTAHAAAQAGVSKGVVRAPFDGMVAARTHNPGDMILSSTDPILRIVDPRRLEVIASIPRADQSRLVTGASARIAAAGVEPVRLTVAGRATDRESSGEAVPFRLVPAGPVNLSVDTPVQIDIDAEERSDTVLVPAEALIRSGPQAAVFVAQGSRAERRVVQTGIQDESRVEITSGLRPGELVITRGQIGLTDGAAVTVAANP